MPPPPMVTVFAPKAMPPTPLRVMLWLPVFHVWLAPMATGQVSVMALVALARLRPEEPKVRVLPFTGPLTVTVVPAEVGVMALPPEVAERLKLVEVAPTT